jgi:uncharacterized protein GlcG (DUF336 family)
MFKQFLMVTVGMPVFLASTMMADDDKDEKRQKNPDCAGLPTATQLKNWLKAAPSTGGDAGGLFNGKRMWGAVVNRDGDVCAVAASMEDSTQVWPGSQAIAKSKAYTGNAFSLDSLALSTAQLYTFTQPGHSLWSLGQSNLPPGLIFFGGGMGLYKNGKIIGGLGISGDTSCTDHEIAKRVRNAAGLNPPGGATADDISYSSADGATVFTHPLCVNTWRNGVFVGNEKPAAGY